MSEKNTPPVVINPQGAVSAAIIWLHGLGADGHDFEAIVPELGLPDQHGVRFIFPHAPMRPVTINGGVVMRAWYDVLGPDFKSREDEAGIRASAKDICELVEEQVRAGIPASRIVLAGFSQGGAMVLHTALRFPQRLAGVVALSTYLPLAATLEAEADPANKDVPIWMAHGVSDNIIPFSYGEDSRNLLQRLQYQVEWHAYPMAHGVCAEEIRDLALWLRELKI
jgi:phospholipase/carboxylesterase